MKPTRFRIFSFVVLPLVTASSAACSSIDLPPAEIVRACENLLEQRAAYDRACTGATGLHAQAAIDSCVGIATAPGSTLEAADIDECAGALGSLACAPGGAYPACVGYGANLLFPNHDKKGSGRPGEACFAHVQCESGYCDRFGEVCGVCQDVRALGEACGGPLDMCLQGGCENGVCRLPGKGEGEACIDYGGGDCQEKLFCETAGSGTVDGVCVSRAGVGAACVEARACAEGLLCFGSICVAPLEDGAACGDEQVMCAGYCDGGVCVKIPFELGEGEDCSIGYCSGDLVCDAGVCKARTYLPAGGACEPFGRDCAEGLVCEASCVPGPCASSGVCVAVPGAGDACGGFGQCAGGAICLGFAPNEGQRGVCVKLGGEGENCPCVEELACVRGACIAFGAAVCE